MSTQTAPNGETTPLDNRSLMDDRLLDNIQDDDSSFTVRSEQDAEKAFRAIKAAEAKKKRLKEEMEAHIQEIKDFYEPKIERQDDSIAFLESRITSFVESTGESVSTPSGKAHTTSRTKWDWQGNRDTLVAWAEQESPGLVQTEKKVSKNDIKKYVKETWDKRFDRDPPIVERKNVESIRCYTT